MTGMTPKDLDSRMESSIDPWTKEKHNHSYSYLDLGFPFEIESFVTIVNHGPFSSLSQPTLFIHQLKLLPRLRLTGLELAGPNCGMIGLHFTGS